MEKDDFFDGLSETVDDDIVEFVEQLESELNRIHAGHLHKWESSMSDDNLQFHLNFYEDTGAQLKQTGVEEGFTITMDGDVEFLGTFVMMNFDDQSVTVQKLKSNWNEYKSFIATMMSLFKKGLR